MIITQYHKQEFPNNKILTKISNKYVKLLKKRMYNTKKNEVDKSWSVIYEKGKTYCIVCDIPAYYKNGKELAERIAKSLNKTKSELLPAA